MGFYLLALFEYVCLFLVFSKFQPPLESLATVEETVVRDKV